MNHSSFYARGSWPHGLLDLALLVPEGYAAYRPLIADGVGFFLERLPAHRLAAIAGEQARMPEDASLAERVVALLCRCPTLHKLGQVVARDRRLDAELRKRLQSLESMAPTTAIVDILEVVREDLGEIEGLCVAPQALAEASVAVVVPFTWCEPGSAAVREGVLKVLKPGVRERLEAELEIWSELGPFLEERSVHHGLPVLEYRETLESVRELLVNEVHLDREQSHLAQARQMHAESVRVLIPRLFPFSTPRVTAMERVYGQKVTGASGSARERLELAETVAEALLATPFWSPAPTTTFHADPHAGNLFVTRDGRLAILDWSLVARLGKVEREQVVQILLGALTLDEPRICRAVAALGRRPPAESPLRVAVAEAIRRVRQGNFPGFHWMLDLLDRAATSGGMGFSEDLVLFRKALLTLCGVMADVSATNPTDAVLLRSGLARFFQELAGRPLAPPRSRAFGTHVSNLDLLGLWAEWPAAAVRAWAGGWKDCLELFRATLPASHRQE